MTDFPPPSEPTPPSPWGDVPPLDTAPVFTHDERASIITTSAPPPTNGPLMLTGMAIAVALAALAFVIGRATAPAAESAVPVATSAPVVEAVEEPTLTSTPPTADTTPQSIPERPSLAEIPNSAEPVAAIAELVGPAVVQIETGSAVGSGVIYDTDGLILTAAHVVEGSGTVTVRLADGTSTQGTVLGFHSETDVAVVGIPGRPDLPTAELAVGVNPSIGSLAVALGSPFGLDQTVTAGVVSAFRTIGGVSMVQTDASINPGNSGGPLVDRLGRVIGINGQIFTTTGANEGVGFAISIDLAALVAGQLVAGDEVQLARLGVSASPAADGRAGALVQEVVGGSAADDAGLQIGDLILSIGGRVVTDSGDLRHEILLLAPGTAVDLIIERDSATVTVPVVLGSAGF